MREYTLTKFNTEDLSSIFKDIEEDSDIALVFCSHKAVNEIPKAYTYNLEIAHWLLEDEILVELDTGITIMIRER